MATKFTFPRNPKIGDRIEIVSVSTEKMPINIVGNSEAEKNLVLIFPDQTYSGNADGENAIATITETNIVYGFRCVATKDSHVWLLEGTCLHSKIQELESEILSLKERISVLESVNSGEE